MVQKKRRNYKLFFLFLFLLFVFPGSTSAKETLEKLILTIEIQGNKIIKVEEVLEIVEQVKTVKKMNPMKSLNGRVFMNGLAAHLWLEKKAKRKNIFQKLFFKK